MAVSDPFMRGMTILRSPPCEFVWGPWRADSYDLERSGWQFERDMSHDYVMRGEVTLAMYHPKSGMAGMATCPQEHLIHAVRIEDGRRYEGRSCDRPVFVVQRMGAAKNSFIERSAPSFRSISMEPELAQVQRFSLADIFARRVEPREQIIVEPKTVAGLLEEIKKMQAPELAAIRERNRWRDETRHLEEQPAPEWQEESPVQIITMRRAA